MSSSSLRRDGRRSDQLRSLSMKYDGLSRADGSGRFKFGQTCCLASVSGPIEVRLASELPSTLTLEVLLRPLSHVPATESKAIAATIRTILATSIIASVNPRSLVQIVLQSCSPELGGGNMGSLGPEAKPPRWKWSAVAAMINASTLALLNAGSTPLRGVVCAVAVGSTAGGLIVDPSEEEHSLIESGGCFAFLFANEAVVCVYSTWTPSRPTGSKTNVKDIMSARSLAQTAATQIYARIRTSVETGTIYDIQDTAWRDVRTPHLPSESANEDSDENDEKMEI